jgi:hypothetical protein
VVDGKWHGTPEQYVNAMRVQQFAIKAEGDMTDSVTDDLRFIGYEAVFCMLVQTVAIYKIWKRLKKT